MGKKDTFTIKEGAEFLGINVHTLRTLKRKGTIPSSLEYIGPKGNIPRLVFQQEDLEEYSQNRGSFGKREDGRNKYTSYLTPEEHLEVLDILQERGFGKPNTPTRANPPKKGE